MKLIAVLLTCIVCSGCLTKNQQVAGANDVVTIGDGVCVLLEDVTDIPQSVCAEIEDLLPLLPTIVSLQKARKAGATKAQLRAMVAAQVKLVQP